MTWIKRNVVMLPTHEKAPINLNEYRKDIPTLALAKDIEHYDTNPYELIRDRGYQPHHLYVISNEEPKENDWCIIRQSNWFLGDFMGQVHQIPKQIGGSFLIKYTHPLKENWNQLELSRYNIKPIIATTNLNLVVEFPYDSIDLGKQFLYKQLPAPSREFLDVFVREYNKGNCINTVMVENTFGFGGIETIKVNAQNEIAIRKTQDKWNRQEVEELIRKALLEITGQHRHKNGINQWLENNL